MTDITQTVIPGVELDKTEYKAREDALRLRLLDLQKQLAVSKKSLLILMNGVEGSGKGETVKKFLEWMDARGIETTAFWTQASEEREYPPLWRFWHKLPLRGHIGIFFGSWYTEPILDRVFRRSDKKDFTESLEEIRKLENMLTAEGVILVKFWMHLTPKSQKELMKAAEKKVATRWRISKITKKFAGKRQRFHKVDAAMLAATHTGRAPWSIIDARYPRYREIHAGELLAKKLEAQLGQASPLPEYTGTWSPAPENIFRRLDYTQKLSDAEYKVRFEKCADEIARLSDKISTSKTSLVLVFEGADAAGKGGAIRRVTQAMDPRHYRVNAFAAPNDVEKGHPYLWRFWQCIPSQGKIFIYDRSWYGRVLVERIEHFCTDTEWQRAYGEINDFEKSLHDSQTLIRKFYLTITPEEQLERFKDRKTTPYKQYKLTEEDWRNRDKWAAYETAACDMFANTSNDYAPWIIVEANDKNFARIKVMESVVAALKEISK